MRKPRSRSDTRTAVLGHIWCQSGSFRTHISRNVGLTEASISRIIAELKAEGVIEESRRIAPYQGGPSAFLTLSKSIYVAALEVSNSRIHVAVGSLGGDIVFSEHHSLPDGADAEAVEATIGVAITDLARWVQRRDVVIDQAAVSIPGFHSGQTVNPIIALDAARLLQRLTQALPGVPVTVANSMVTRAVAYRLHEANKIRTDPYLFVYTGHGVGAAFVEDFADGGSVEACELGHMVVEPKGNLCRCGHRGCLETLLSSAALADVLGVAEADLIARGDQWIHEFRISAKAKRDIGERLFRLGLAIGNALNVSRSNRVVVTGWTGALPEEDRALLLDAIGQALLGGAAHIELTLAPANFGREPATGLALASHSFVRRGGARATAPDEVLTTEDARE